MIKATFKSVFPYLKDAMNLPVKNVETAIPFYEKTMGFKVMRRQDKPIKFVVLARDGIQIGLAENGGDPTQDGCFFEVDNVELAFEELNQKKPSAGAIRDDKFGEKLFRVFFVVAPDGLCYMLGERVLNK